MAYSVDALWRSHLATNFFWSMLSRHDDFVDRMDDAVARRDIPLRYVGAAYAQAFTFFSDGN